MEFCIYNAIKTPDGTILYCENRHDYHEYKDTISGELYLNDGHLDSVRRSVNTVPYEDLSIYTDSPHEIVRTIKFWTSYGKDGKSAGVEMSLQEMEKSHIEAILRTQKKIQETPLEKIFINELEYRVKQFKEQLDETLLPKESPNTHKKKL